MSGRNVISAPADWVFGGGVRQCADLGVADCEGSQGGGGGVVDSLGVEGGVPAEEAEAAGADGAEGVAAAGEEVEGGCGEDGWE